MKDLAVVIKGISKHFDGENPLTVIEDLNLGITKREFLTVVGASGCGKSTLLNLIAGLDSPSAGTIQIDGKVALMFQDATLLPWLTALQNIKLALKLQGLKEPALTNRAKELLETVRLGPAMSLRPHQLSGGMKQRVALARCLAQDASIVLMDEPLGALDAMTRDLLHDEIEGIVRERGLTVVFVTHNMREAVRLGDRVILMGSNPGRIVHEENVQLEHPRLIDSPAIATRAAKLTKFLRAEQSTKVLIGADS